MKTVWIIAGVCLVISISGIPASGSVQHRPTAADIRVTTRDPHGGILLGVDVTVVNAGTGLTRHSKTDGHGVAEIPALPPGEYSIQAAKPQFLTETRQLQLPLGTRIELSFTMTIAGTAEYITVTADPGAAGLHPGNSSVISRHRIDALPANGRNFISFALTTPGVNTDRMPQQGASATSGLSFAGQRARANNITVDGLDNNDAALGAVRATFSQEAVQEFQVLPASYPAEFGKASGGVLNIVTRSGANRTTGNVFAYVRNEALNARDHFEKVDTAGNRIARPKARYRQIQTGATLGGPIQRGSSFYFLAFERLDVGANNFVTIDDADPVLFGSTALGTPAQILRNAGFAVETGQVPYRARTNSFLVKTDHHLSSRQTLAVRFNQASAVNENSEAWGGLVGRSRGAALESEDRAGALLHTWIGGQRLVHEFRAQYARRNQNTFSLDPKCGGHCLGDDQGGPTIEVTGTAYLGRHRFTPQPRSSRRWQVVDTISVHSGAHVFKAGLDVNRIHNRDERLPLNFGGRYVFAASLPGSLLGLPYESIDAIQAVALGYPAVYVQGYGNPRASYSVADVSGFFQDEWRLSQSVRAGLGVRYQKQFWPDTFPADNNNLAPRLSLAWDAGNNGHTTLQAAYGLFFESQLTMLPAVARVLDGEHGVRTLAVQFPDPLVTAAWNAPGRRLTEADAGNYPSAKFVIDPRLRTPFAHHLTSGLSQRWNANLSGSMSGVFVWGHAQLGTIDYNPLVQNLGPGRRPADRDGVAGTSASILQFTSFGRTWYRGLNLLLDARHEGRYQISAAYTLAKSEDTSTDYQSAFIPQNNGRGRDPADPDGLPLDFDPAAEKGFSVQDQRHRLVVSGIYEMPGRATLSGVFTAGSGRPYSVIAGADLNGDGNGGAFPSDRARRIPSEEATALPRNSARLPASFTIDARLSRKFEVRGGIQLQTVLEVFNVLNRTNYTDVNNVFGSGSWPGSPLPAYGRYTQAAPQRQAQIALKLMY